MTTINDLERKLWILGYAIEGEQGKDSKLIDFIHCDIMPNVKDIGFRIDELSQLLSKTQANRKSKDFQMSSCKSNLTNPKKDSSSNKSYAIDWKKPEERQDINVIEKIEEQESKIAVVERKVNLAYSSNQFIVRLPKEIELLLGLKKEKHNTFKFIIDPDMMCDGNSFKGKFEISVEDETK